MLSVFLLSQVKKFVAPSPDSIKQVEDWLAGYGLEATPVSPAGDWLKINVTVEQANTMLHANFRTFKDESTGQEVVRTLNYSLPAALRGHLDFIHPTIT